MRITNNSKIIFIVFPALLFLLNISILAQEKKYDASKEPTFDKNQILKTLTEIVSQKESVDANIYIIDNFLKTGRYQAGIFAIQSLKTIPGYEGRSFMEDSLCLCYVFSGEDAKGMNCMWELFLKNAYPNIDINKISHEKKAKIEREYYTNMILIYLGQNNNFDEEKRELLILKKIDEFFKKYPNPTKQEIEYLNNKKKMVLDYQALKKELSQRKTMRRKQILDYVHELEKLLVERDEKKLSALIKKYAVPDMQEFFLKRYIKFYFNKNYSEVHFNLIADSSGESIHLTGMEKEITDIEFIIKTIPDSKGNSCPETLYSGIRGELPCHAGIRFKFDADNIYIF